MLKKKIFIVLLFLVLFSSFVYAESLGSFNYSRGITITNSTSELDSNFTVCLDVNSLVGAKVTDNVDGNDMHIFFDTTDLNRVIWDDNVVGFSPTSDNIKVCFKLQNTIVASAVDTNYTLAYGTDTNLSTAPDSWADTYLFGDNFDNNTIDSRWNNRPNTVNASEYDGLMHLTANNSQMYTGTNDGHRLMFDGPLIGDFNAVVKLNNVDVLTENFDTVGIIAMKKNVFTDWALKRITFDGAGANPADLRTDNVGSVNRPKTNSGSVPLLDVMYQSINRIDANFTGCSSFNNTDYNCNYFTPVRDFWWAGDVNVGIVGYDVHAAPHDIMEYDWFYLRRIVDDFPSSSLGAETATGVPTASYTYSTEQFLDTDNKTKEHATLIDTSTFGDYNLSKTWTWFLDSVQQSTDQNTIITLPYAGDFNVSLIITGEHSDGNTLSSQQNQTISITAGYIRFHVRDENTFMPLQPTITVNGDAKSADANGYVNIDLNNTINQDYTILISDANRTQRTWLYQDLNQFYTLADVNLLLLETTKGLSIEFLFYEPDETTLLSNAIIEFVRNDVNAGISSRILTNSNGEATIFLNSDSDYNLSIIASDDDTFNYYSTTVSVLSPKKESDGTLIEPVSFDVMVGGLAQQTYLAQAGTLTFSIFANTTSYYSVTVDVNETLYFERKYDVRTFGNPLTYSLQPYMADATDGTSIKLITRSKVDLSKIANVRIKIFKFISGAGKVLIEDVTTDAKGEAYTSGIINDDYSYEVWYLGNLVTNFEITVTSTEIYITFNPDTVTPLPGDTYVNITFSPSYVSLGETTAATTLKQTVFWLNNEITAMTIYAKELDVNGNVSDFNLYRNVITTGITSGYTNTITIGADLPTWDTNKNLLIYVEATLSDGNIFTKKQMYIYPYGVIGDVWEFLTSGVAETLGSDSSTHIFLTLVALLVSLAVTGGIYTANPFPDMGSSISLVFVFILAIFVIINWVHWALWLICLIVTLAYASMGRRTM